YGARGLVLALLAVWVSMGLATIIGGVGLFRLLETLTSGANLGAGVVAVVIGWVAAVHERRAAALAVKLADLEKQSTEESARVAELRDAAVSLRARADRLDHSLAFLTDVSGRLHGDDPVAAAEGALALALARTGARAGLVQVAEKGRLRTVAL